MKYFINNYLFLLLITASGSVVTTYSMEESLSEETSSEQTSSEDISSELPLESSVEINFKPSKEIQTDKDLHIAALSSDGKLILTGSEKGRVGLWNSETGESLLDFQAHRSAISSIEFSLDTKFILTRSFNDKTVALWDLKTGALVREFTEDVGPIYSAVLSPDSRTVLTGTTYGAAVLRDVASGSVLKTFKSDNADGLEFALTLAFSPTGKTILVGLNTGSSLLWDVETGTELHRLKSQIDDIIRAAFSSDGKLVLTGSLYGTTRLWNVETGVQQTKFQGPGVGVEVVAFNQDDTIVFSGVDEKAFFWEAATGKLLQKLRTEPRMLWIASNPYGNSVLTASFATGKIVIWKNEPIS